VNYLLLVAFIGGAFSVLTPCVLPLLPAILVTSGGVGRRRILGLVAGIEVSFFGLAIVLAGVLTAIGLPYNILQWVAAALILGFGIVLIVPRFEQAFSNRMSRLTGTLPAGASKGSGLWSGFAAGIPLGLVWAPCAGPILAGVALAGGSQGFTGQTVAMMFSYALGMFGPLLLVAIGGRRVSHRLRLLTGAGRRVSTVMGVLLIGTAAMIAFGWLNQINQAIAQSVGLTSTPTAALERRALTRPTESGKGNDLSARLSPEELEANGYPETDELADLGPAPDFIGITNWYNTEGQPLSIASLRGKVVLVDFWTYSCINCIRTFPHLKKLDANYRDDGFVLVGVHTPEFEFEKDPGNVGEAIKDFEIRYPVALDPEYRTWNNYYNRYWPAHYLIDRDGQILSVHYGEGAYERTENQVRELLALPASIPASEEAGRPSSTTPETYLGFQRAERFAGSVGGRNGFSADQFATYDAPDKLSLHEWSYAGSWNVHDSSASAGQGAEITLRFSAKDVFLVAGPGGGGPGKIEVSGAEVNETITVDGHRLYTIRKGELVDRTLRLKVSAGLEVFAFTFG
jgi:cytochrome c biogenesis protein CcdA/thiol-disulfide isomerase/thioredoxin